MNLGAFAVSLAVKGTILTFNPGWDDDARPVASFTDIRELQRELRAKGAHFGTGSARELDRPGSLILVDPDGNTILLDQHV